MKERKNKKQTTTKFEEKTKRRKKIFNCVFVSSQSLQKMTYDF